MTICEESYSTEIKNKITTFKDYISDLQALSSISAIASWDLETKMPPHGAEYRAWALSIMAKLSHEKFVCDFVKENLEYFRDSDINQKLNKTDKAIIRVIGKEFDKTYKIPKKLIQELSELTATSHVIWAEAKKENNFKKFEPHLKRIFDIKKEMTNCIGYKDSPYDTLLDSYEDDLTVKDLNQIFSNLKSFLIPFVTKIKESMMSVNSEFLTGNFSSEDQLKLSNELLSYMGYDFQSGRLDESHHPFTIGLGPNDVRVTTNVKIDDFLSNIGSTIHEGGHALYELGVDKSLSKIGLGSGASLGIHESQSRLYETIIGQGYPFWKGFFPRLTKYFQGKLSNISLDDFYKVINIVKPSLVRVESDEVTYNLHIVLRYELERDVIEGKLEVQDLKDAWNSKMQEYFGIIPEKDGDGVLQDVHWSWGAIGYFPTYAIGNLCAAQFYNSMKIHINDLESQISSGNMNVVREWLKENIHKYGMLETPKEIIQRVTGESLNAKYFVNYIEDKYNKLYF